MTLDTTSPSTIVSLNILKEILKTYPKEMQAVIELERSNKRFEFGGKAQTAIMWRAKLPMYLQDVNDTFHLI